MQWRWLKARRANKRHNVGEVIGAEPEDVRILDLTATAAEPERGANDTPSEGVPVVAGATRTATRRAASRPKTDPKTERKTPAKTTTAAKPGTTTAAKAGGTKSANSSRATSAKARTAKTPPRSK
jgi:hypothetical protein